MQYLLFSFWLHSVWQSLGPSTSLQMVQFHSILWLSNIPLYICPESESEWKVTQSCMTLCNALDCIVHGILQAWILEWVAVPFSRGSFQSRDWTQVSHISGGFFTSWATREAQEYWSGEPIPFPVYLLNQGLLHCRWFLYQQSYQEVPCFLYPFICWWMNWGIWIGIYPLLHVK